MGTGRVGPGERRVLTDVWRREFGDDDLANSKVRLFDTLYATTNSGRCQIGVHLIRTFPEFVVSHDLTPTIGRVLNGTDTPLKMLVRFGPCVFRFA